MVLGSLIIAIALFFEFIPGHHRLCSIASSTRIVQTIYISMGICKKVRNASFLIDVEGNIIPRQEEARKESGEPSQAQEEAEEPLHHESTTRVPPYTPPPTDPILAYLQCMETTLNNRMQALEDSLQEAYTKLDMIIERFNAEGPSSPSETF